MAAIAAVKRRATAVISSLLYMGVTMVFTAIGGIVLLGERWMIGRGTYPHDPPAAEG